MVKVNLMRGISATGAPVSPTVQLNAAIAVTDKTQMPVDNTITVGYNEDAKSVRQEFAEQIAASVEMVKVQLAAGVSLDQAQKIGIRTNDNEDSIDAEIEE